MGQFVAGWYPDPLNSELQRWWDGTAWSEHTAPRQAARPVPVAITPAAPAAWAAPTVGQPARPVAAKDAVANDGRQDAAPGSLAGSQAGVPGVGGKQGGKKPSAIAAFVSGASVPVRLWSRHRTAMLVAFALNTTAQIVVYLTREAGDSTGYLIVAIATLVVCVAAFAVAAREELHANKIAGGRRSGRSVDPSITGDGKRIAACGVGVLLAGLVTGAVVTFVSGVLAGVLIVAAVIAVVIAAIGAFVWVFGFDRGSGVAPTEERGPEVRGINSHFTEGGPAKVEYGTQRQASDAAFDMGRKTGYAFSTYVCERGGHYHIGKTR